MRELMTQQQIDANPSLWLAERRKLITGTDIAAILWPTEQSGPNSVYYEKTAGTEKQDTMAMFFGRHDESAIADLFEGNHPDIHPGFLSPGFELTNPGLCVADDCDWMGATYDRLESPDGAVVEIKQWATKEGFGDAPNGEIPVRMHVQLLWECAVAGAKLGKLVVRFTFNNTLVCYWVKIEDNALADIAYAKERATRFRDDYLLPRKPPPADGYDSTAVALKSAYSIVDAQRVVVPKRMWQQAVAAKKRRDAAKLAYEAAKNQIAALMGTAAWAVTRDGKPVMQRSPSWPSRVDLAKLRAEYAEAAEACTRKPPEDQPQIAYLLKGAK